jgi:hypothetical protein
MYFIVSSFRVDGRLIDEGQRRERTLAPSFIESEETGASALPNRKAIDLTRAQILAFRRRVGALDKRLPPGARSLRQAAWAGLQDSMPRAALLSIHARVEGAHPSIWEHPSLVQVWGPRYSTYVVPARDRAVFTVGRLPDDARGRQRAEDVAARLHAVLAGRRMTDREVGMGNRVRYAAPSGTVLIRRGGRAGAARLDGAATGSGSARRLSRARGAVPARLRTRHARVVRHVGRH